MMAIASFKDIHFVWISTFKQAKNCRAHIKTATGYLSQVHIDENSGMWTALVTAVEMYGVPLHLYTLIPNRKKLLLTAYIMSDTMYLW